MSAPTLSPEAAEQRARELLDSRIASVRELVTKSAVLNERREALTEAEAEVANSWRAALRDGWSVDELKSLGLSEPTPAKRRAKRTRKPASATASSAPAESAEAATDVA